MEFDKTKYCNGFVVRVGSLALVSIRPRPEKTVVFRTASAELGVGSVAGEISGRVAGEISRRVLPSCGDTFPRETAEPRRFPFPRGSTSAQRPTAGELCQHIAHHGDSLHPHGAWRVADARRINPAGAAGACAETSVEYPPLQRAFTVVVVEVRALHAQCSSHVQSSRSDVMVARGRGAARAKRTSRFFSLCGHPGLLRLPRELVYDPAPLSSACICTLCVASLLDSVKPLIFRSNRYSSSPATQKCWSAP